jgi:hypothetical protein
MKKLIVKILYFLGLKKFFYGKVKKLKLFHRLHCKNLFNRHVIMQNLNYKSIPIIIISFNQLFYLKQLVSFLQKNKYQNIVIIDNNSNYKPLLDYFEIIESTVTLHRLKENFGHLVFWKNKALFNKYSKGYYIVTDADIVPVAECPEDFVLHFKKILNRNEEKNKVGFSLKIDDIPDSNPNKQKVIDWEHQFWKNETREGNYNACIDTTFALYRPKSDYKNSLFFLRAIRTNPPYIAIHGGWYFDINNLTEEQNNYLKVANKSSSWNIDVEGNLFTMDYD